MVRKTSTADSQFFFWILQNKYTKVGTVLQYKKNEMTKAQNYGDDRIKTLGEGCYSQLGEQDKVMVPCNHVIIHILRYNKSKLRWNLEDLYVDELRCYKLDKKLANELAKFILRTK